MKTERLFIADIEAGERLRTVDLQKVAALKASIGEIGLRTPITVSAVRVEDDWSFRLVAGAHRLEALRQLGEEFADAFVMEGDEHDAELWEIDENLARAELTAAQRADHHARREAILKARGLVSAHGGKRDQVANSATCSYAKKAAAELGVSERKVRQNLARGKNIDPEVLRQADDLSGQQLDELARTPRELQAAKAAEIRERQEADKLNRYADKAVARSNADEAAEIIHANLDLDQVDALMARLAPVSMKDFLAALSKVRAA